MCHATLRGGGIAASLFFCTALNAYMAEVTKIHVVNKRKIAHSSTTCTTSIPQPSLTITFWHCCTKQQTQKLFTGRQMFSLHTSFSTVSPWQMSLRMWDIILSLTLTKSSWWILASFTHCLYRSSASITWQGRRRIYSCQTKTNLPSLKFNC